MAAKLSFNEDYRKKITAYEYVRKALQEGTLVQPKLCTVCGTHGSLIGHHQNYDRPLHVRWVCPSCHQKIHKGVIPDFEVQWYLGGRDGSHYR
jgi:ribosomal protein S27AE